MFYNETMRYFSLVLLTFLFAAHTVAVTPVKAEGREQAQTASPLFLRYLTDNPDYNVYLRSKLDRLFKISFPQCDSVNSVQRLTPKILTPVSFRDNKSDQVEKEPITPDQFYKMHPSNGQWIDRSLVTGCGQTTQLNMLATGYDIASTPEIFPLLNGQTNIEIIDQRNAESAVSASLAEGVGCYEPVFVLGSVFLGYKSADNPSLTKENQNAGWYERWVVRACNTARSINLAIVPDGKTRYKFIARLAKEG